MKQAYGYLRVSGNSQLQGEGTLKDGFRRQRLAMEKYAAANGYAITRWFEEKAVPGKTEWADRPAWVDMIGSLNGVRTIFIETLNRLARDLMVQEHIIADLRQREVELISVGEPDLCVDDPGRKVIRQVMGAFAEYDRAMIVAKLGGARKRMKEATGVCEGRKPYGERDGERQAVERMKELRTGMMTFGQVATQLTAEGYRTRYGGAWIGATVAKIMAREKAKESHCLPAAS